MVSTGKTQRQHDAETQNRPDEARNAHARPSELLARDGRAVQTDDVCVNSGKDEDDEQKVGKASRVKHFHDEKAEATLLGVRPLRFDGEGRSDASTCDHAETGGDGNAEGGHEKDLPSIDVDGVVDIVIGRHGAPTGRRAVVDCQQGKDCATQCLSALRHAFLGRREKLVGIFARFAVDDEKDDEEDDPGVFFVDQNRTQANKANREADAGNDDDADSDGDRAVGDALQGEPPGDAAHCCPAELGDGTMNWVSKGPSAIGNG